MKAQKPSKKGTDDPSSKDWLRKMRSALESKGKGKLSKADREKLVKAVEVYMAEKGLVPTSNASQALHDAQMKFVTSKLPEE